VGQDASDWRARVRPAQITRDDRRITEAPAVIRRVAEQEAVVDTGYVDRPIEIRTRRIERHERTVAVVHHLRALPRASTVGRPADSSHRAAGLLRADTEQCRSVAHDIDERIAA